MLVIPLLIKVKYSSKVEWQNVSLIKLRYAKSSILTQWNSYKLYA